MDLNGEVLTVIIKSSDRKVGESQAHYTVNINGMSSIAKRHKYYACYLDMFATQVVLQDLTVVGHRMVNPTATRRYTGYFGLYFNFNCPFRFSSSQGRELCFILPSSTTFYGIDAEIMHKNPIIVSGDSLSDMIEIGITDDSGDFINPDPNSEHIMKLTFKPINI